MAGRLTHRNRPGHRQVLKHRPRSRGETGTFAFPPMEAQVDGGELAGEVHCGAAGVVHPATMQSRKPIANPDEPPPVEPTLIR
jgi:hypothetical protein